MNAFRRALAPVMLAAAVLTCSFALVRSQACPVYAPPQPLRTLYKSSERVVVARVGARQVLKTEEDFASVRVALNVSEVLKGPTDQQVLHLYRDEYVGKGAEAAEDVRVLSASGRPAPRLKRGEQYLFFLEPREEGGGYEVNDEGYGIKELSDADLKVYLERIKELSEITRQEPEDRHALLEWLVRCAEHDATRWDGAYELSASAEAARAKERQEAEVTRWLPVGVTPEAPAEVEARTAVETQTESDAPVINIEQLPNLRFARYRYTVPDPKLAPMLNAVQKQRLADALFASTEPSEGDDILMRIVKEFDDARFPAFVLARLHRFEQEPPYEAEFWLSALADSLKNDRIVELAASYSRNARYDEDEEETEAETEASAEAANDSAEDSSDEVEIQVELPDEPEETPEQREAREAREKAAAERATRKRSAMLKGILTRIDLFVTTGQLAPAER
ncbi:MAG TPA: hypothetical protein VF297_14865 [Pyrinomonadaceae bacterium]